MKILSFIAAGILLTVIMYGQDSSKPSNSLYRISLSYGVSAVNPKAMNERIASSNAVFGSAAKSIKSLPEISLSATVRPLENMTVFIVRGGYISTEREFTFSAEETAGSSVSTGTTNGVITETYSAYPFSIGVGTTTPQQNAQFSAELIYGLGYITEEGQYTSSSGKRTSYTRSVFSPTYGFRFSGTLITYITPTVGIQMDAGYRYLFFDEFEDEVSAQPSPIVFSMSGIHGSIGVSVAMP